MIALGAWSIVLGATLAGLLSLPSPSGHGVEPAFAAVRLLAIGLDGYVMTTLVLGLLGRVLRAGAAVRVTDLVTLPGLRAVLDRAVLLTVVASVVTPVGALAAERPADPPPVMRLIEEAPPASAPAAAPQSVTAPADTHVVEPGQHCWSISELTLGARLQRPPSDAETAAYWRALVAANADRLAGHPDLIFAGQVLRLP